jgi:hypothetical protein
VYFYASALGSVCITIVKLSVGLEVLIEGAQRRYVAKTWIRVHLGSKAGCFEDFSSGPCQSIQVQQLSTTYRYLSVRVYVRVGREY